MDRQNRIPPEIAALITGVAVFFDGLQAFFNFILIGIVLNPLIITPFAFLTFYIWFKIRGVNFLDSMGRSITLALCSLCESIPIINTIPAWTIGAIVLIVIVKNADRIHNKKQEKIFTELEKTNQQQTATAIERARIQQARIAENQQAAYTNNANDNEPQRRAA